ncbi:MAG: hypothetical protein H6830_03435 [Planctomycetes bacterium]|nr:hypothetical protein [Planctomycetota bacterium]MCB9910655.1 hypothetical protein [Planctomycetota bacterium]HPF13407.1 DUF5658 family protein [Planctomycetota bacterium]
MTSQSEFSDPPPGDDSHSSPMEVSASTHTGAQVARGTDRRSQPTPRFSRYTFGKGRRRTVRRQWEVEGTYVDRYSLWILGIAVWVALMNTGDSYFTLVHLQSGGIELNPFAQGLLRTGRFGFVAAKGLMITLALLVLVQHKNFWLARLGLWIAALAYTLLNLYHLSLF